MKIHVRGLIIELEPGDPRAEVIEALLFGRPEPEPEPLPEPSPVPQAFVRFWREISDTGRKELRFLAEKERTVAELEKQFGFRPDAGLRATHVAMARVAHRHGMKLPLASRGRLRESRRFRLSEEAVDWVRRSPEPWSD